MDRMTAAIGAAEVLGAVGLVAATFTIPAFADMALAWRVMAVFMLLEGVNRVRSQLAAGTHGRS